MPIMGRKTLNISDKKTTIKKKNAVLKKKITPTKKLHRFYLSDQLSVAVSVLIILGFTIFIIIMILLLRRAFLASYKNTPTITNPCSVPSLLLRDFSNLQCCSINNNVQSIRYDTVNSIAIAPYQTWYISSCSSYCNNGLVTGSNSICSGGVGQVNFNACIAQIQPNSGCKDLAKPYGIVDGQLYYLVSGVSGFCTTTTCPSII